MSIDYQPIKNNRYWLPPEVYKMSLALIRDYDRLKSDHDDQIQESPAPPDGMPRGTSPSDPTGRKAAKLEADFVKLRAVDHAMDQVAPEYRRAVWRWVVYRENPEMNVAASYYTVRRWRQFFIWNVAWFMNWI